jgi:hypothetical protein
MIYLLQDTLFIQGVFHLLQSDYFMLFEDFHGKETASSPMLDQMHTAKAASPQSLIDLKVSQGAHHFLLWGRNAMNTTGVALRPRRV